MKVAEIVFYLWVGLVAAWWVISSPESAPQQAALAGQALVLVCIPYTIVAVMQRARNPEISATNDLGENVGE